MPERERITLENWCQLAVKWGVSTTTMRKVAAAAALFSEMTGTPGDSRVWIVSGARTDAEQNALRRSGRPAAANNRSTHLTCPATGVDISLGLGPSRMEMVLWGDLAVRQGLRWGGGGEVNEVGVPVDWQHVDLGPRTT